MSDTIVVLVNGEVLANGHGSSVPYQRENARELAEALAPILASNLKIAVLHGNKPQVGFVLFRSEIASHVLHAIPLDICGADTQGATGFILSQAFMNVLRKQNARRQVLCVMTQTLVDATKPEVDKAVKTIGPWYDRDKAEQYRQTRGWVMLEEPGHGYRRAVPLLPPVEILEIEGIKPLVESGALVIAAGGGGIPVTYNAQGNLVGVEAVVETERVAIMMAHELKAETLLMVIEKDAKYIMSRLGVEKKTRLTPQELDDILLQETINSRTVRAQLKAASAFLHAGGKHVIVTTLRKLPQTLLQESGLWIGAGELSLGLSQRD